MAFFLQFTEEQISQKPDIDEDLRTMLLQAGVHDRTYGVTRKGREVAKSCVLGPRKVAGQTEVSNFLPARQDPARKGDEVNTPWTCLTRKTMTATESGVLLLRSPRSPSESATRVSLNNVPPKSGQRRAGLFVA